jgi:ketosteroid isomerase-like protein
MSRENVELVRAVFDSFNRGDVDGALERVADDSELDWSSSIGPAKGVYRGREGFRELWTSYLEAFELRWDPEEIVEVDESRLIVMNHIRGRGRGSGVGVDVVAAQLWTISEAKVRRVKLYQSKAEALEAVGVRE